MNKPCRVCFIGRSPSSAQYAFEFAYMLGICDERAGMEMNLCEKHANALKMGLELTRETVEVIKGLSKGLS